MELTQGVGWYNFRFAWGGLQVLETSGATCSGEQKGCGAERAARFCRSTVTHDRPTSNFAR